MVAIIYILSVIAMITTFILVKKSEEKVNFVNWCVLSGIVYLGFNIAICMIFGTLNITTNLVFLSVVDFIVSLGFGFKIYKDKQIQSLEKEILLLLLFV